MFFHVLASSLTFLHLPHACRWKLQVAAQRPKWEVGAKAALPLKRTAAQPAAAPAAGTWPYGGGAGSQTVQAVPAGGMCIRPGCFLVAL